MKNALLTLFSIAASAGLAAAQFMVNTPNTPIECVPTLIQWNGGSAPYTLLIQEPDANGTPVQIYQGITDTSFSWPTNITAGTSIGLTVRDNTGQSAQSAPVTIQAGSSDSCIGAPGSAPASTPGGSSTSAATSGSSTPGSTPGSTSSTSSTSGASTSSPAPSGSSTTSRSTSASGSTSSGASPSPTGGSGNNGAMGNAASLGAVGLVGAVIAAIMA